MQPDPKLQSCTDGAQYAGVAPPPSESAPPLIAGSAGSAGGAPPALPPGPKRNSWTARRFIAVLLNLGLGLFVAESMVSLLDDYLTVCFDNHTFAAIRGILFFFAIFVTFIIYWLMAFAPMIPKGIFLPVTIFKPVAGLIWLPFLIYYHNHIHQIDWVYSFCQLIFALGILCWTQGGFRIRVPLFAQSQFEARRFSWRNLGVFAAVNFLVLLPAVALYLTYCAGLAVDHFSDGFMALRRGGLTVRVRKYARKDGKTIELVPMSHVAEPEFYRELSQSFPTNSVILMEGVSDNRHLLTNKISYQRMATSLGVTEQVKEFKPSRGGFVRADVDVEQFTPVTIDFLNLVMLLHAKGINADTMGKLMEFSPPPHFEEQLMDDILRKRNRRLLNEIHTRLPQSRNIIVPWGVAHMPEIAREIQKSGFRLEESREYVAIRFGNKNNGPRKDREDRR